MFLAEKLTAPFIVTEPFATELGVLTNFEKSENTERIDWMVKKTKKQSITVFSRAL